MFWKPHVNFFPEYLPQFIIGHMIWDYFINVWSFYSTVSSASSWGVQLHVFRWIVTNKSKQTHFQKPKTSLLTDVSKIGHFWETRKRSRNIQNTATKYWAKKQHWRFVGLAPAARSRVLRWPWGKDGAAGAGIWPSRNRPPHGLGWAGQPRWPPPLPPPPPAERPQALLYLVSPSGQGFIGQDPLLQLLQLPAVGQVADH